MRTSDAVIAGAGIIGLSAALELARLGLSVTVLEQGSAMREASWAAAGMLAAGDPESPPQMRSLAELSRTLYPDFLHTIEELSGVNVPLRTSLTLQGVHSDLHTQHLLDPRALHALVPDLISGAQAFIPIEENSLDPRDLCRALPLAATAAGVTLLEHTTVQRVERAGDSLRIETGQGEFAARHYLQCCGAWPGAIAMPVEPRKGQILIVKMPAGAPVLACVLRTSNVYLVPRGNGRIVIGATLEQAGFDRSVTDAATETLLTAAAELWPPIWTATVLEGWAGLRPCTPDGLPIIGSVPLPGRLKEQHSPGAWMATGHFRNGILLAPATARLLGQLVLSQPSSVDLHPFTAVRFAAVQAAS